MTTMTKPPPSPPTVPSASNFVALFRRREYGVLALLLITLLSVGAVNPAFLAAGNLRDILVAAAPAVIVGCGLTFVVLMGEIDISMGASMGVLATVMGQLTSPAHAHLPVAEGIAITLALGAAIGLTNGLLVAYGRMPSIIVTLGMMTILQGVNVILMNGHWITDMPSGLRWFGLGRVIGIPVSLWITGLIVVASIVLARDTPLGRRIYASGSNPSAAVLTGLPVRSLKLFVFTLTGLLTAVATVVSVPLLSVIEPGVGSGFELLAVTCVVVGGTSISGGKGTIAGTLLAALLLSVVRPTLIFLKLGPSGSYWERAIQGAFILAAVLLDHVGRSRRRKAGA